MSDKMREEFEIYARGLGIDVGTFDGIYYHATVQGVAEWRVWKASRAALCVELPADCHLSRDGLDECYQAGGIRDQMIEAIHAAGVKTK